MVDATQAAAAKISLVEAEQNLVTVDNQCIVLQVQLNQLTGLSPCTGLVLEEPPLPKNPFGCADEVVGGAVSSSPKLNREAKMPTDPFQLKFAIKDRLESELGAIKADLDYRNAVVEVRSIAGYCE